MPFITGKKEGLSPDEFKELLVYQDDQESSDSSEDGSDQHYRVGGQIGFQTNVDDFLKRFDIVRDAVSPENKLIRSRTIQNSRPLLDEFALADSSSVGDV